MAYPYHGGVAHARALSYTRLHLDNLAYVCAKESLTDMVLSPREWVTVVRDGGELKDVFNGRKDSSIHARECANHLRILAARMLRENRKFANIEAIDLLVSLVLPDVGERDEVRLEALAEFMTISSIDHELQQNMMYGSRSRHNMSSLALQRDCTITRWADTYDVSPSMFATGQQGDEWRAAYLECTNHKLYSFTRNQFNKC